MSSSDVRFTIQTTGGTFYVDPATEWVSHLEEIEIEVTSQRVWDRIVGGFQIEVANENGKSRGAAVINPHSVVAVIDATPPTESLEVQPVNGERLLAQLRPVVAA